MEHFVLAEKLRIAPETVAALRALQVNEKTEDALKALFWEDQARFDSAVKEQEDPHLLVLWLYLKWALETISVYRKGGIPEQVIFDCLQDLRIWSNAYRAENGLPGINEWRWNGFSIRGEVIRLGRLQFQPKTLKKEIVVSGCKYPSGTQILEVHIPAEEPLDPEAVCDSLHRAPVFFKTYYDLEFAIYHCHSWLISPQLPDFLPEQSRILQFMRLFAVYSASPYRQAEERVYGYISDNPMDYPENTSLQRSLKQYLLSGKTVGMGYGIIPIK